MRNSLTALLCLFGLVSSAQENIDLVSYLSYPDNRLNDVWGYEDSMGTEYALVGTYEGTSIVSLLDPANPTELFFVDGPSSIWREIRTHEGFAYVTNETGEGLMIIDLRNLPASIDTARWTGSIGLQTGHNIFIDEQGYAYVFGSNIGPGGADILDLNVDPWDPVPVGTYDLNYIHDGFVRGDTLWSAEIYAGQFSVVDVSNKDSIKLLATHETPLKFAHHCWPSDDNTTLFVVDERPDAYLAAYDVSDLTDIKELHRIQSSPGSSVIPHNTFYKENRSINSYYKDGVVIFDVSRPQNLVEVANFDTSPFSGSGFSGCWGVYPYLNSGLILASDIEEGLFVLQPQYARAGYFEGLVTQMGTSIPISDVEVEIMGERSTVTGALGAYKTGVAESGSYTVRYYHPDCYTIITTGVNIDTGAITVLNQIMECPTLTGLEEKFDHVDIRAGPSPFQDLVRIDYDLPETGEKFIFELSDVQGRIYESFQLYDGKGSIFTGSDLSPGTYFCRIVSPKGQKSLQIVKSP